MALNILPGKCVWTDPFVWSMWNKLQMCYNLKTTYTQILYNSYNNKKNFKVKVDLLTPLNMHF